MSDLNLVTMKKDEVGGGKGRKGWRKVGRREGRSDTVKECGRGGRGGGQRRRKEGKEGRGRRIPEKENKKLRAKEGR